MPRRYTWPKKMTRNLDAWDEGRRAAREGQPLTANPYRPNTSEATSWERGWNWRMAEQQQRVVRHV